MHDKENFQRFKEFVTVRDSFYDLKRVAAVNSTIGEYQSKIMQDSLSLVRMEAKSKNQAINNQRLGIMSLLLSLSLISVLLRKYYKNYLEQQAENLKLVFKKEELERINNSLKLKLEENAKEKVVSYNQLGSKIEIKSTDKLHLLNPQEILYVEAEDNGIRVHTVSASYWSDIRLKNIEAQLSKDNFIKIFRGTVINISHVKWVNHSSLMMQNDTELKVSRTYKEALLALFK